MFNILLDDCRAADDLSSTSLGSCRLAAHRALKSFSGFTVETAFVGALDTVTVAAVFPLAVWLLKEDTVL